MIFSLEWLRRYVPVEASVEELAARLTAAGLAVEGLQSRGEDTLLDVDVTTNRPDCMNHHGLARELSVLFDLPLASLDVSLEETGERTADLAEVEVEDPVDCPRYVARIVRGVKVGPSPEWLVERLESVGLRSINNVVDASNFVLWEMGQPTHAFDLERLAGAKVVVRRARPGERLVTLDGEARVLDPEALVIGDGEGVVGLAGVMGGLETEVTSATSDILIESAHFDPRVVRETANRLGMHTDASHRFERGADPGAAGTGADRVAKLIVELAGGSVLAGAIDVVNEKLDWGLAGRLDLARLDRFAGARYSDVAVERWLTGLGFGLEAAGPGVWTATVPTWRHYDFLPDPARPLESSQGPVFEADLFEEAMRIRGFDDIAADLPAISGPEAGSSAGHLRREEIRRHLAACGYMEAVSFAFHDRESEARRPALARVGDPLTLANPLSELYTVMRRSLLPGLESAVSFNQRRGAVAIRLFEIGHVFPGGDHPEVEAVAIVGGGSRGMPWDRRTPYDLFDLKGVVESLAEHFGAPFEVRPADLPGLVPGTGSELFTTGGRKLGHLGRLASDESPVPLFAAELSAELLTGTGVASVRVPSRHPGVEADLTLTHSNDVHWSEIERAVEERRSEYLVSFGLKDRYRGEGVPAGAVNTTVFFRYNAADRSLTQEEVNERHQALTRQLEGRFGWSEN